MSKKKEKKGYAVCGKCAEPIDLLKLHNAMDVGRTYVHYCGRVLHWGGSESEVPTNHLDDPRYREYWDGERSSPSTGDA